MSDSPLGFFGRLGLAWRVLISGPSALPQTAAPTQPALPPPAPAPAPVAAPKEDPTRGALVLLAALQREGRLVDFVKDDITSYPDADIGAAARTVHAGVKKVLDSHFPLTHAVDAADGSAMTVPVGFDNTKIRLVGNVSNAGPWKGTVSHHGWVVSKCTLPIPSAAVDASVIAPAEVELP